MRPYAIYLKVGKRCFAVLAVTMLLILAVSGLAIGATTTVYEYEEKDQEAEQKKYLIRLQQDKKKVELAVRNTKVLIDRSRNKPYLPELYLRLAELYIEKSRIVYFIRKTTHKGAGKSSLDQLEANMLKNQAIEIYKRILDNYPDFEYRDKVHFFMAHEFRELGKTDDMILHYKKIIKNHPQSAYVPESYLLLGDYFIGKQDVDTAKRQYESVLKYSNSPAIAIARYKLAWCFINKADYKNAIFLFEKAVESAVTPKDIDIDTYKRVDVRLESLVDMAYCYPEVYKKSKPEEALQYFHKYSWSRQSFSIVLEKLAYRYYVKKQWRGAAHMYRELADLRQDPESLLDYTRKIFDCAQAIGKFQAADRDVALIIKALKKQRYSVHIDEKEKAKNYKDYELYARDIITHLHKKARKAKSQSDFKRAADAYKLYLGFFDDSPVRREMESNYAEALFSAREYIYAGKQYEELVPDMGESPKERKEKLYSSVISYYNALKNRDKKELTYYQVAYAQEGLRTTGKLYAGDFPSSRYTKDVLFNVAWVSYDAGKHDQAITEFTQFIQKYPNTKASTAAVHLVLDVYHQKEDYEGMTAFGKKVIGNPKITDSKLKAEVNQIIKGAESKIVSSMTLAAVDDWEKGKNDLMDIAKKSKSSAMGEHALSALVVSSKDKKDLATLYDAGETLIEKYPKSSKAGDTLNLLIDTSLKVGQYRYLADNLEMYATKQPKDENTREFLAQAGSIREELGQYRAANTNYQRYLYRIPKASPDREKTIFTMATNAQKMKDENGKLKILNANYKDLSASGRVRADSIAADIHYKNGQVKKGAQYRNKAKKGYKTSLAKRDPEMNAAFARMEYNRVYASGKSYMALQLTKGIDNKIVTRKTKLLAQLEKNYQNVINYQSPEWALKACFRAHEINSEFARFLKEAPVPELSAGQKKQYVELIAKKAAGYEKKAQQYLATCIKLAHKWEVCDPKLAGYFNPASGPKGREGDFGTFSGKGRVSRAIKEQSFSDQALMAIHQKLLDDPDNAVHLLALSEAYIQKGDFGQAVITAQGGLSKIKGGAAATAAKLYNLLGVAHLYLGDDRMAREEFKTAIQKDKNLIAARINLSGLYKYYGHQAKAGKIMAAVSGSVAIEQSKDLIHPRAGELYYVGSKVSQK